ncbi:DUF2460 domain-containing protein [Variovorax paradoxus]|nr:DUF2460 domain-containing protein [Variovorax paradoxus]
MPTVFADVILSNSIISSGIRGKNMRKNSRVPTDNGSESINVIWTQTLREFEIATVPLTVSQWREIENLHEVTDGGAYGFLLEDPKDNRALTGVMANVSTGVYQLYNRRTHAGSSRYKDRKITRPRALGFVPMISAAPIDPANYTLDVTTGRITIPAAPSAATLTWTGLFYTPVNFVDDFIDWSLVVPGAMDARFWAGPSVVLMEIRE